MRVFLCVSFLILLVYSKHISKPVRNFLQHPPGELHALLIATSDTSNTWGNYRHQADVAHAYHTLTDRGVPAKNIVVMMKDDIAYNPENPFPGQLFNAPTGPNVYKGLTIDYKGDSVTVENFLNVLQGKSEAVQGGSGRVLNTGKNDRIFVYSSGHGSSGILIFPDGHLSAKQLNSALEWMYSNRRYRQLVYYVEACESGSMFHNILRNDINVYAVTAAGTNESSYGTCYHYKGDLLCLFDEFSLNWMEDAEKSKSYWESLGDQYVTVRNKTKGSHVMRYGDLQMSKIPTGWFQGIKYGYKSIGQQTTVKVETVEQVSWPSWDSEYERLRALQQKGRSSRAQSERLAEIEKDRELIHSVFDELVGYLVQDPIEKSRIFQERSHVENPDCHDEVMRAFNVFCVGMHKYEHGLRYMNVLNNLCTKFNDSRKILKAMAATCLDMRHHFF